MSADPRSRPAADRVDALDAASRGRLALLRVCALECRAARRLGLAEACARLSGEGAAAPAPTRAEALVRTLPEALGRRLAIRRPGEPRLSFDEAWLLALLAASARRDAHSVAFLLRSRALPRSWRALAVLVRGLAAEETGLDLDRATAI